MGSRRVWGLRNCVVGGITIIGFWFLGAAGTVSAQSDSSQQPFSIAGHVVSPGTTATLKLLDSNSFDAAELSMPLLVAHGAMPGPVLCLTGGIHGDEINGVEVARRAFAQTDASTLKGTLVVAPLINHEGFRSGSRYMPDRRDLNRYFPGHASSSVADYVASNLFETVIANCDALIDLHTASFKRANQPQIRVDAASAESFAMARHFAQAIIVVGKGPQGSLRRAAVAAGIPAIIYEAGGPLRFEPEFIEPGVAGVVSVMRYLDMLDGEPVTIAEDRIFRDATWLRVPNGIGGGFFFPTVPLGAKVSKDEYIGYVVSPTTNISTEVHADRDGEVIGAAFAQPVLTGYALLHIGVGGAAAGPVDKEEAKAVADDEDLSH